MITEEKIFAAFPGKALQPTRSALLNILWAYESIEGIEAQVGPIFNRVVAAGAAGSFDMESLINLIEDHASKLRNAAHQLNQATDKLAHGA